MTYESRIVEGGAPMKKRFRPGSILVIVAKRFSAFEGVWSHRGFQVHLEPFPAGKQPLSLRFGDHRSLVLIHIRQNDDIDRA